MLSVPIFWRSRGQKGVTLSINETEYVAMSEAVKDIILLCYLLESLRISATLPIVIRTNDIEDGLMKIIFVRTEEIDADIFTKIVSSKTYEKPVVTFLGQMTEDCKFRDKFGIRRYHLYLLYIIGVSMTDRVHYATD